MNEDTKLLAQLLSQFLAFISRMEEFRLFPSDLLFDKWEGASKSSKIEPMLELLQALTDMSPVQLVEAGYFVGMVGTSQRVAVQFARQMRDGRD